mgnify:CR=1 FL=1
MARKASHVIDDLNARIDDLTERFRDELAAMIEGAKARAIGRLQRSLTVNDGRVGNSRQNKRTLRNLAKILREELARSGVAELIEEFGSTFAGQLPMFEEVLDLIGAPKIEWSAVDLDAFAADRLTFESGIETILDSASLAAQRRVMFSVGGMGFGDLVDAISVGMRAPVAEAVTLAETGQAAFWRTITDRGFQQIEKNLPKGSLRYRFEGPRDKLTRPFCKRLLARTKSKGLTRAQIDALDNGQLPNVFLTAGGYRCRHQWVAEISTR